MAVESRSGGKSPDPGLGALPRRQRNARPAIKVSGVSKDFRIPDHRYTTLKERVIRRNRHSAHTLHALRDVSFEVGRGEFFGILGRNGSGKSTLLKTIAGIQPADRGTIETHGTISPMLALGVGFHPELAAKDNVLVNGALVGIGRQEMLRRFPAILEFAELEEFEELPLKNYSSGMMLRLAFAAGIHVDADILLLDEIIAVGDMRFVEKCFDTIRGLKDKGKTIVLVTHGLATITQFCDRAMFLDHGSVISIGEPERVVNDYTTMAIEEIVAQDPGTADRWGDGSAEIVSAWFEDFEGKKTDRFHRGEDITLKVRARFHKSLTDAHIGFSIRDHANHMLFDVSEPVQENGTVTSGSEVVFAATFEGWLNPGHYDVWPIVAHVEDITHISDLRANYVRFMIEGESQGVGPMFPRTQTHVEAG
jgi:ABC-type polysaccharide/polyol phosphate transport system ATPase subunit